jgi:hypothetical protein
MNAGHGVAPGAATRGVPQTPATQPALALDHLVVATADLGQGVAWCEATLGIVPGQGGRHARFGTHNRLFRIDGPAFARAYFEIIAIDPEAPPPTQPRWFGLDDAQLQARLAQAPRLVNLVARVDAGPGTLEAARAELRAAGADPGEAVHAWRETPQGRLEWEILVRADGQLGAGGVLPTLIRWRGRHPVDAMPASGVMLLAFAICGLDAGVRAALPLAGVALGTGRDPALRARLATPKGDVTLEGP